MTFQIDAQEESIVDVLHLLSGTQPAYVKAIMPSKDFVVDDRSGDRMWSRIIIPIIPIKTRHILWMEMGNAADEMRRLQQEWHMSSGAFPAVLFSHDENDQNAYSVEWAMVEPGDFFKSPGQLIKEFDSARSSGNVRLERSRDLVYTSVVGKRPPGSTRPPPLTQIPGHMSL